MLFSSVDLVLSRPVPFLAPDPRVFEASTSCSRQGNDVSGQKCIAQRGLVAREERISVPTSDTPQREKEEEEAAEEEDAEGSRQRTATAAEKEEPRCWRRRSQRRGRSPRAPRDPEFCLAYARTNPGICASFLPTGWRPPLSRGVADTASPLLSLRVLPGLSPASHRVAVDFSRAPNSAPSAMRGGSVHAPSAFDRRSWLTVRTPLIVC